MSYLNHNAFTLILQNCRKKYKNVLKKKKFRKAVRISFPCSNAFLKYCASHLCVAPQYHIADSIFSVSVGEILYLPLCVQCLALKRAMFTFQEVCTCLEEVVVSRIKHYLEAPKQRGQWKSMEHASSSPLFVTGKNSYLNYSTIK